MTIHAFARRAVACLMMTTLTLAAISVTSAQDAPRTRRGQGNQANVIRPFNRQNLDGWDFNEPKDRSHWKVGLASVDPSDPSKLVVEPPAEGRRGGQLVNAAGGGVDIISKEKFGDCVIELEVMVPKGSNSGIYVMGEYEVQVLDSYGKEKVGPGDLGGLYNAAAPKVNAAKEPGQWQTFVIDFTAPKFEGDRKVANAKFNKVTLNDQVIHENVEMKGPTPTGVSGKEAATGPLMFQGDHGAVAYRRIRVTPKPAS